MRRCLAGLIRIYQYVISPMLPPRCVYEPTCSNYAIQAIETHGAARGAWLAIRRLLRCHPFARGGFDPVPECRAPRSRTEEI